MGVEQIRNQAYFSKLLEIKEKLELEISHRDSSMWTRQAISSII